MPQTGDLLSEENNDRINKLALEAAAHLEKSEWAEALEKIRSALAIFPEPAEGWQMSFLLMSAGFSAALALGQHDAAHDFVRRAAECAETDEFAVSLMRGQLMYERGDEGKAAAEFLHVLLNQGPAAFANEEPRYYEFACKMLRPPAGCASWDDFSPMEKKPWWRFW